MKLVKFSVTNFRSLKKANDIPISLTTVLVGKNNEGKSNLLRALSTAMRAIEFHAEHRRLKDRGIPILHRYSRHAREGFYNWERDFPIASQGKTKNTETWFRLEFELNNDEILNFKEEIGSNLNGTLPLEITCGRDNEPKIKVAKGGRGSATLNAKSAKITDYIARNISFNYIPAVRTHDQMISVIDDLVSREFSLLEDHAEYKKALAVISDLQRPVIDRLSKEIKEPLCEFLPNIKEVRIQINEESRKIRHRRDFEIIVDDGTATSIEYKGDGVKSLAALGLLKNISHKKGASIIAIEEPESHLHPGAIHQLQEIISSLEKENQVVLTTHNPLFVNRASLSSNIVVDGGNATPAKNIRSIRDILGVRISDNLASARYALIVEGKEDKAALTAIIPTLSEILANAIKDHSLIIDSIGGAGGLSYKLSSLESQLCTSHVFLDHDLSANNARDKAMKEGLLTVKNLTQTICNGMNESEFEDCLALDCYKDIILNKFGVQLNNTSFRGNKKWSERMKNAFLTNGRPWNENIKASVKLAVSEIVAKNPTSALCPYKRTSIDALVSSLEMLVKNPA